MKPVKKIHILLVVRWPVGGIRTFLRYVYSHFEKDVFSLSIILPQTSELDALRDNFKSQDVQFFILPENPSMWEFVITIFNVIRQQTIDLVHAHGLSACIYTFFPAKLMRVPHLFTSHDAAFSEKQFVGVQGFLKKKLISMVLYNVNIIHSVSHDAQEKLLSFFPILRNKPDRLVVIPNGVEVDRFLVEEKKYWRQELCLPPSTFLIGFFGRFMAPKGFRYLVDAIGILAERKLAPRPVMVLALGWGGFIREEQEELARKGLKNYFKFLPFEENIAEAIRGVDVVVMPSLWEAYGLLATEVMVAGVPLIGTNCIGLREVLRDTPARVVPVADSKSLADAIIEEMKNPSHQIVESYRQEAAQRFDVRRQIKVLKELIYKLAGKN